MDTHMGRFNQQQISDFDGYLTKKWSDSVSCDFAGSELLKASGQSFHWWCGLNVQLSVLYETEKKKYFLWVCNFAETFEKVFIDIIQKENLHTR